ncbi:DUF4913 domain-containing protein [Rhodococcus hoagii]|nr:DUF4913 domain-containing protein [Prescottella equi]
MSNWWIRHCDPHLRVLLDGQDGPMSHATGDGTWLGHGGLSIEAPPERGGRGSAADTVTPRTTRAVRPEGLTSSPGAPLDPVDIAR